MRNITVVTFKFIGIVMTTLAMSGLLPSGAALAASPCPMPFLSGSSVNSVDGVRDSEWDDALLFESGSACLEQLIDFDFTPRDVRIYSKSFVSAGNRVLALFFEIEDQSNTFPIGFTEGERLVMHLDPDFSGGSQMNSADFKFDFRHIWHAVSGSPEEIQVSLDVYDGGGSPGICDSAHSTWQPALPAVVVPNAARLMRDGSSAVIGYTFEVLISESAVGPMSSNVGIGIGIVNDWAECSVAGICDDHGIAFPSSLPMTNTDNPLPAVGCDLSWDVPDTWATGYFDNAPADVTISHVPAFWRSEDVDGLACTSVTENRYFPGTSCRLRVRSRVHNSASTDQIRNLLYLFGVHGAGSTTWNFIELRAGVVVPALNTTETVSIFADDDEVATIGDLVGAHPCIRVYILPPSIAADFDLADMQNINSSSDLTNLVNAYGLESQHSAQQNISRQTEGENCPDTGCNIIGEFPKALPPLLADAFGFVAQQTPVLSSRPGSFPFVGVNTAAFLQTSAGSRNADAIDRSTRPPELTDLRGLEEFVKTDIIVQVVAMAYREPGDGHPYNLIETVGGVVDLVPVSLLDPENGATITFQVTNPAAVARTIRLVPQIHTPEGYENVKLVLDTTPQEYAADETRTVKASVTPNLDTGPAIVSPWSFSAHIGGNDPHGSFGRAFDSGASAGLDLTYNLNSRLAIEAYAGVDQFERISPVEDLDVSMLAISLRAYATAGPTRVFAGAGVGHYWFDFGGGLGIDDEAFGAAVSAGVQIPILPRFLVEGTLRYNKVNIASDPEFLQYHAGIRIPF